MTNPDQAISNKQTPTSDRLGGNSSAVFLSEVLDKQQKLVSVLKTWDSALITLKKRPIKSNFQQASRVSGLVDRQFGDLVALIEETEEIIFLIESKGSDQLTPSAIEEVKESVFEIKRRTTSKRQTFTSEREGLARYSSLASASDNKASSSYSKKSQDSRSGLRQMSTTRQFLEKEQDEHLDDLHQSASRLGALAETINVEIEEQNKLLDDLDTDLDHTMNNMEGALRRMDKLFKSNNRCETCTILTLVAIAAFLFFLIASTI